MIANSETKIEDPVLTSKLFQRFQVKANL